MTLSEAYKKVLNESAPTPIEKGTTLKELAEQLKTIAFMIENRMSTVQELGMDKVGDKIIAIGQKIKTL